MNTNVTQKTARQWSAALSKTNEAKPGMIAIAYADEQGNKHTGYIDLMEIEVDFNGKSQTIGNVLGGLAKAITDCQNTIGRLLMENTALQQQVATCESRNAEMLAEQQALKKKYGEVWAWLFPDTPFGL